MLQSTTILCETATVAGATGLTAKTAVKYETDEKGNKTAVLIDKKRTTIGTAICTSASVATYGFQQESLNNTLNNVNNAQAYVESLSEDKLAELSAMLDEKQVVLESSECPELVDAKKTYTKK